VASASWVLIPADCAIFAAEADSLAGSSGPCVWSDIRQRGAAYLVLL